MKINYVNTIIFNSDYSRLAYLKKITGPQFLIGKYNFIGGKVDEGESNAQAAIREVKEEAFVSLDINQLVPIEMINEEYWSLETFAISVDESIFSQIKQTGVEPVFFANVQQIREDAITRSSLYSPDFLFFLEKAIALFRLDPTPQ